MRLAIDTFTSWLDNFARWLQIQYQPLALRTPSVIGRQQSIMNPIMQILFWDWLDVVKRESNREHDEPMPCRADEGKAALALETIIQW